MAEFVIGKPVETEDPTVEVTVSVDIPLAVGKHVFQLVVEDDSGNQSLPATVDVVVRDSQAPTAILAAPSQVDFGQSFKLDGSKSSDVGGGKVVKFIWTLVE
ncbi:MAG TPA: hypothetical protein VGA30_03930 [Actinomycetota bacterium]